MDPTRTAQISGHVVREYYWAGDYPVYVDNQLRTGSFEEVVSQLERESSGSVVSTNSGKPNTSAERVSAIAKAEEALREGSAT